MTVATHDLPRADDLGVEDTWTLLTERGEIEIRAVFLGFGSSQRTDHWPVAHPNGGYESDPVPVARCRACRWYELRIFRELDGEQRYFNYHIGVSIVPGEKNRHSYRYLASAHDVIDDLATRRHESAQDGTVALPAAQALDDAIEFDDGLAIVWEAGEPA